MNILIVGKSDINELLTQELKSEGFSSDTISCYEDVTRVQGRPGAYILTAAGKKYEGCGVIVTERPYTESAELFDAKALNLLVPGTIEKIKNAKGPCKAAFLLDYAEETPEFLTVRALEAAISLANAKKDVYFLSMFVKAASAGMEKLFLKARQAGVTFIKYEQADPVYDEDSGLFSVIVSDGVIETVIETPYLITVGTRDNSALASLSRKFRLADKKEIVSEFKYFLSPALTTRKGIFYIGDKPDDALPYIISELKQICEGGPVGVHAEIEAGKCAFCYSCYRACPHAALEPDIEAGAMVCVENACMACGICAAICPGEAITMAPESRGLSFSKGKASGCKVYCCENSAGPAFDEIAGEMGEDAKKLDISEIPCGGRLDREVMTAALSSYGKVLVAVCIDDACRHMNGGKRACKQVERVISELEKSELCDKKVKCVKVSHAMPKVLLENVKAFLKED